MKRRFYNNFINNNNINNINNKVYELIVGLEIHAQIQSPHKLFSYGKTRFGALTNSQTTLFDCAIPGTLPVLNKHCISQAIKTGLALNSKISKVSTFDRKHYFYPDLPHGYQITQQYNKLCVGGNLAGVELESLHVEMDSGASFHDVLPTSSLIDLNRAGSGLMEIVTKPVIHDVQTATNFVKTLQHLLRHIGTCNGNMEQGSLRCDVNISVRKKGDLTFGTRSEIKNLGSIKQVGLSIAAESKRHIELLQAGLPVDGGTRFYDLKENKTVLMRKKENEADYRFLPEPDLPFLIVTDDEIQAMKTDLPELPWDIKKRIMSQYNLSELIADRLLNEEGAVNYFEKVANLLSFHQNNNFKLVKRAADFIVTDLFGNLHKLNLNIPNSPVKEDRLSMLLQSHESEIIFGPMAKEILKQMMTDNRSVNDIVSEKKKNHNNNNNNNNNANEKKEKENDTLSTKEENGMTMTQEAIEDACRQLIKDHPKEYQMFKNGNKNLTRFFVSEGMKRTNANPKYIGIAVNKILKEET